MDAHRKDLTVVLAPNPSPLTGPGTNSFLIGRQSVAVIDPGPDIPVHRQAIMDAAPGPISHIFVTHAHLDHSQGAAALAEATGAPILAFGPATAGRSAAMARLAAAGEIGGGEGADAGFVPDRALSDGEVVAGADWHLQAIHTPGHFGGHLAFLWGDTLFSGDIVLGWSSTLISPPDGDLADYFRSLDRIAALAPARLMPAHGDSVDDVPTRLAELAAHRRQRSAQIMAALRSGGPATAESLARSIYDVPPGLIGAATRNVLAHLIALQGLGAVDCDGPPALDAAFHLP